VFALVAVLQALLITSVYLWLRPGPTYSVDFGSVAELFTDLAAVTVAAMTLGLLTSAALPKLEQAIAVVTGVSIAQIALNGVASNLSGNVGMNVASMVLPSRWGLAAAAASIDLRRISPTANPDALWHHSVSQWTMDLAMLGALTGAYFLLSGWLLSRRLNKPDK
jgi:ABC transport system ATP-binding/permease protein